MKISVVIPAFNVAQWVGCAVESALCQTASAHEVIVVDDGSTDGTASIVHSFEDRVRLLRQVNTGLAGARNAGAAATSGTHIFFLDGDDYLVPEALEVVCRATRDFPHEVDAVAPNHLCLHPDGSSRPTWPEHAGVHKVDRSDLRRLTEGGWLAANALIARGAWEEHPYRGGLKACEDLDMWASLLLAGRTILATSEPVVVRRMHRPGSLSGQAALMRRHRRTVFASILARRGLTATERLWFMSRLARSSAGHLVAALRSR